MLLLSKSQYLNKDTKERKKVSLKLNENYLDIPSVSTTEKFSKIVSYQDVPGLLAARNDQNVCTEGVLSNEEGVVSDNSESFSLSPKMCDVRIKCSHQPLPSKVRQFKQSLKIRPCLLELALSLPLRPRQITTTRQMQPLIDWTKKVFLPTDESTSLKGM